MVFPRTRRRRPVPWSWFTFPILCWLIGTVTAQTIIWTQPVPPPVRTVIRCPFA